MADPTIYPDPELRTSPILDEDDREDIEQEAASSICYWNGQPFHLGDYVRTGGEVLRCAAPGVWVRQGEVDSYGVERS